MAQSVKPLFFELYDHVYPERSSKHISPHEATSDSCPTSISSSPSLESLVPSLIFSDDDTEGESTSDLPESDKGSIASEVMLKEDEENDSKDLSPLIVQEVDSPTSSAPSSPDLLSLTPLILNSDGLPSPPKLEEILSQCGSMADLDDSPWYKVLVSGTSVDIAIDSNPDHTPYLDQLRYTHALELVKSLSTWNEGDLAALARDLIWCVVEPKLSDYLSLRDVKRVTLFAVAVKSAFLELQGNEMYAAFVDTLVDVAVGLFMNAWNIDANTVLFSQYLPIHVQTTIRLTAFIGDLYVCGLMRHVCFRTCFFEIINRLGNTYEFVMAFRVLLEAIGKRDSPFWEMEFADQLFYAGGTLGRCGTSCDCLVESGITRRPGFREGVAKYKMRYARMFYERILKGRSANGGMPSWTRDAGVSPEVVNSEVEIMFLQMGFAK
ncbi:hypothetical protein AAF712_011313 [Marasmius tenuissimus]|uniref:Uncharacterized protein n=1 Tax=Marasmius tenuissimus TaxID=585030 RepID=A0ABR2ZJR5_9AGAR